MNFQLICPACKTELNENMVCESCGKRYTWLKERLVSFQIASDTFYEQCYGQKWGGKTSLSIPLKDTLLSLREKLSLSTRRERFFRRHLTREGKPLVLDVACGYGRRLFTEYASVIGLDVVLKPLNDASEIYDLCVHADAFSIPFPNEYFDCVVSSDFLGHIPLGEKDALYQEFYRVLKADGKMIHIIETDAINWHFRFAHQHPELFQKYFIEGIGGHFGLELPSKAIARIENNGFKVLEARKIWGELWQVEEYKSMFDNEYREKSRLISVVVSLSKVLSANLVVQEVVNIMLNPISAVVERLTPLDNGQGLMVFCQKV